MAWTNITLPIAIRAYVQSDEATLITTLPTIIKQAEDRLIKDVQLPNFRKNVTGTMTADDQYLSIPTDFLAPYSLMLEDSGAEFLLFKTVNFMREAYPTVTTTGTPKHYAIFEDDYFIVGPTPDSNFQVELHYYYSPESITTATSTWLGDHAESALLYGCLIETQTFLKGPMEMIELYEKRYKEALNSLKVLGEGRMSTDEYRSGS